MFSDPGYTTNEVTGVEKRINSNKAVGSNPFVKVKRNPRFSVGKVFFFLTGPLMGDPILQPGPIWANHKAQGGNRQVKGMDLKMFPQ
jgi:hypothetical protein